jgi:hypothetical protein
MDPNANLDEQRMLVQWIIQAGPEEDTSTEMNRLADLVGSLDEWLCNGNALPDDWNKARGS